MSIPGAGSGVKRHGKRTTGMRQIAATASIATAVIAIAITPPAFARVNTGGDGSASGSNSDASHQSSYSASRVARNVSGAPRPSGAGSAREFSSSGGKESWHRGGTPPGLTGHGEEQGCAERSRPG